MNIEKNISEFTEKLRNKNQNQKFVVDFCLEKSDFFVLIITKCFFKFSLDTELKYLFENAQTLELLNDNKIIRHLYSQDFKIIKLFSDYDLHDVNENKDIYLNKAINDKNLDFLDYILDKMKPFQASDNFNYNFFVSPVFENDKVVLTKLIESDKIELDARFLNVLLSAFNMNDTKIIAWLLNFDKVSNLCSNEWSKKLPNEKQQKFFSFLFSIKSF